MKKLLVTVLFAAPLFTLTACGGSECPSDTCDACEGDALTTCEENVSTIQDAEGFSDLNDDQQAAACSSAAVVCGFGG